MMSIKYVSGHGGHTCSHTDTSMVYNALDAPQGVLSTYVIAGIDMRANADLWGGKGERKELPGHRPGRPEARASASRAAIGQRLGRAGARNARSSAPKHADMPIVTPSARPSRL